MTPSPYSPLVHATVHCSATAAFTPAEWLELALAALDHAGLPVALQLHIEKLLPTTAAPTEEGADR